MNIINSLNNQKIKDLVRLKKAGERREAQMLIIDGAREIEKAKKSAYEIRELFYCPALIKKEEKNFFGVESEKITEVSEPVFRKICYKENPDGFFAVVAIKKISLKDIKLSKNPLVVILEAVEKPGNLGAIIRTAYAAGVEAIIINDNQTDIYNPNVIRASEGFVFNVPIIIASVVETQSWLKKEKIISLAAATGGKKSYTEEKMNMSLAIILGSEAYGLSDKWLTKADKLIKIPMVKGIDSLNVSVSAAILIYEAHRQREK
ncbi:MAG: RNA methyltransferase [Patescibacteria group bacterium]